MEEKQVSRDTICRDCVFADMYATTGSFGNDKTQTGCKLGFLEKYKEKTEVVEESEKIQGDIFETNLTYYRIKNRMCIGCRNEDWKSKLTVSPTEQIEKELALPVTYLIYINDNHTIEDIEQSIRSINSLTRMPDLCIFIDNSENHNIKLSTFGRLMKEIQTKWKIVVNATQIKTIEQCIDAVSSNITGLYFSVYSAGSPVYDTEELYYLLRVNLEQIVMLTPDEYNEGLTILTAAYFAYGQNKDHSIISKIQNQAEIRKCQSMIRPVTILMSQ